MDIYKQAEEYNADYYDFNTGYIYKIQEYNLAKKTDPEAKIRITDEEGNTIGYARRK